MVRPPRCGNAHLLLRLPPALARPAFASLLLLALALLSRLPQWLSPDLLLDGDEAVLGVMAQQLAAGGPWPVYFYGQHYGLSLFEAAAGALMFGLLGVNALALKAAMGLLWTGGLLAYHRAFRAVLPAAPGHALLLAVTLCLSPAWAVWSMKARGGYLTAFTLSGLLCWLLLARAPLSGSARPLLAGALFATIGAAQALWLPGLVPIVLWAWWRGREGGAALAFIAGAGLCYGAWTLAAGAPTPAIWSPPGGMVPANLLAAGMALPSRLLDHLCGAYYLHRVLPCPSGGGVAAQIMAGLVAFSGLSAGLALWRRQASPLVLALVAGCVATLLATLAVAAYGPRYLLPFTALFLLLLAAQWQDGGRRRWLQGALLACCVGGALGLWQFRSFSFQPGGAAAVHALVEALDARGVRAVFSHDGLLQWQIAFYSGSRIVARSTAAEDRYPPYVTAANALLRDSPAAVAEVGLISDFAAEDLASGRVVRVAEVYGLVLQVDEAQLRQRGFAF